MRTIGALVLVFLVGCSTRPSTNRALVFNIHSADVVSATAEPLDSSRFASGEDFKAQIHIVFCEDAARKFQYFTKTHAGRTYELQVNGEILLPAVGAQPAGGREAWWYTTSVDVAKLFAASLNKK